MLEVLVKQKLSTKRGVPWMITTEACLQIEDAIDWRRSSPYSVQEIKYAFGVEAARDCILQVLYTILLWGTSYELDTFLS